jgi:hypothetical protein
VGKTFGKVPLGLLSVIPGNQTYFTIENTFSNLNFYEFVSDQYATLQWNHNFNGRIFPEFRLCANSIGELISIKGVYGSISDENRAINASGLVYNAPEKDIGNTALVLEIFSKYSELILLGEPIISTYQKPIDLL